MIAASPQFAPNAPLVGAAADVCAVTPKVPIGLALADSKPWPRELEIHTTARLTAAEDCFSRVLANAVMIQSPIK